jgi:hypothetical protein
LLADDIVAIEAGQVSHSWLDRFLVHAQPFDASVDLGVSSAGCSSLP